ncbi:MAG: ATP-binding protein [Acidobacteriota bacterium]
MSYPRGIRRLLAETVSARRVTILTGPRQSGKTTLAEQLLAELGRGTLRRLDNPALLEAATADPIGFVATGERPLVIDEIQHAGDPLVRAIKECVDRDKTPGQFLLTGSMDFLTAPTISESLAGRAAFLEVWPLTQGELAGSPERFIDIVFNEPERLRDRAASRLPREEYLERLCRGGYPEALRLSPRMRGRWFADYVRTIIDRDITEQFGLRKADELRRLLRLFAARTAGELVMEGIVADAAVAKQTVYDHRAWLETAYLLSRIPAWSRNLTARAKRRAKILIPDPGLASWLLGKTPKALVRPTDPATGQLVETFVATELLRQLAWADIEVSLWHWQDRDGAEIDLVLEAADGRVLGIEVKAGASATAEWFKWLAVMRDRAGPDFVHGIAFYAGDNVVPFGDRLTALPIEVLWSLH